MMLPPLMLALMYFGLALAVVALVYQVRSFMLQIQAMRQLVRLLAERDEYRPLLRPLMVRVQHGRKLQITEHEAIDLREEVRRALVHLPPTDRKRVEAGLYAPMVEDREVFLRNVLTASLWRMQRQPA
jgi:hypothetical protein